MNDYLDMDPTESIIEVFYGEVPLFPTTLIMRLFIGSSNEAVADVMTRYIGQSPAYWAEKISNVKSCSFAHTVASGQEVIMYLRETDIASLIKEGINVTWLLSKLSSFPINEDNAKLQADFVDYIVRAVLNSRNDITLGE